MNNFERIAKENDQVKIITTKDEEFIGKLVPMYSIIKENGKISNEIYISQTEKHKGNDFGCVGLALSDIKFITLV